jgi:hypothetical protein
MDMECGSKIAGWMRDAGFEDVKVFRYKCAYGGGWLAGEGFPEGERVAKFTGETVARLHHGMIPKMLWGEGWSKAVYGRGD